MKMTLNKCILIGATVLILFCYFASQYHDKYIKVRGSPQKPEGTATLYVSDDGKFWKEYADIHYRHGRQQLDYYSVTYKTRKMKKEQIVKGNDLLRQIEKCKENAEKFKNPNIKGELSIPVSSNQNSTFTTVGVGTEHELTGYFRQFVDRCREHYEEKAANLQKEFDEL